MVVGSEIITRLIAGETVNIDPKLIVVDPDSGLRKYSEDEVYNFARSLIGTNRILQAIQVKLGDGESLTLTHGAKRLAAAMLMNYTSIPVVLGRDNSKAVIEAVVVQEDLTPLTPLQQAEAYQRIIDEAEVAGKPIKQKDLASIRNKSPQTISDILKLNELHPSIKDKVRNDHSFSREVLLTIAKKPRDEQTTAFDSYIEGSVIPIGKKDSKPRKTSNKANLVALASADAAKLAEDYEKLEATQKENFWKVIDMLMAKRGVTA